MVTYFKSMANNDGCLETQYYNPENNCRCTHQTLDEILHDRELIQNTRHSALKTRLCASVLTKKFSGSYRPEGLVFETDAEPAYSAPFDVMMLTDGKTFTSSDYYSKFIPGYEKFLYKDTEEMLKADPKKAMNALNKFRKEHGLDELESPGYNEVCFEKLGAIRPVALVGKSDEIKNIAERYNLPLYETAKDYVYSRKQSLADFTRKSVMGAIYRVGASFTIDALVYLSWHGGKLSEFFDRFQWDKFAVVTAAVVGINFVDYKFDVTNKLDRFAKNISKKVYDSVQGLTHLTSQ